MCQIILFPMAKRAGHIRHVADRMLDKPTSRSAEHYRKVVTEAAVVHFRRAGIPDVQQYRELTEFWQAVEADMARICWAEHNPGAA